MIQSMDEVRYPPQERDPQFPHAPSDWTWSLAEEAAREEGLVLGDEHLSVVLALQEYFFRHEGRINFRELHDALDEEFHAVGGIRHLYQLFPGGPVAQGCRLAGLDVPAYAVDRNFGSVV